MASLTRPAVATDAPFLWKFLAIAAQENEVADAAKIPGVAKYLEEWIRPGDFGLVAEEAGQPLGAAWARQFSPEERPFVYVGDCIPELAIGVTAAARGKGVGSILLDELILAARLRGCRGLCLNVRENNPAIRLYSSRGFKILHNQSVMNRSGGLSLGMLLHFGQGAASAPPISTCAG